ncbi:hypothetical protein [Anaerobutyricum hallii]|jgi:hypothetical protein|uniref:Uncharacterized protein n=1 Tax=Anaerobutyricum hallii TaxID=39488 RepID=A0A415UDI9_9FIRM|nr:hypothetical protein [Anaerobutyricum hallii]RHK35462.1 hypothetical protein DW068_13590 [Anaerobutyricum hallii]RHN16188.1 hypothetical protein DWZ29_03525 [Anaerobutyricum hallii]
MQNFEFRKHMVVETNFKDNGGKKEGESSIDFSGDVAVPKGENNKIVIFRQEFKLGKPGESVYMCLKTHTVFEYTGNKTEADLVKAQEECYPVAVRKLYETIKNVTEAYGMPIIPLPQHQ